MSKYGPIIPALRYDDAPAAIEFLVRAFGFEVHFEVAGEERTVAHAQLNHGDGMIMLGSSIDDDPFTGLGRSSTYVIVDDPDAHHERAAANGAEIVIEPMSPEYGGRAYTAMDTEGNYWSFGDYDPE